MRPRFDISNSVDNTPVQKAYDPLLSMLAITSSIKQERSSYEDIEPVGAKDIDDTEALRRAIHRISNYYNTLGIYRDDFDRAECDRLARNAYYALCEKATLDYLSTADYSVKDKLGKPVKKANEFLESPNPQEDLSTILKIVGRDLVRYDQGVIVKSFNRAGYMTEMKAYSGPEFWVETDRVLMDMTGQYGVNFQGFWTHGYIKRWWQRSNAGVYIPFHPEEVCRFMMYPRSDGVYGTDFLKFLKYQIQYLIDSTRAAGKTFENGIVPSLVWEHPDIMTFQQLHQRIKETQLNNQGSYRFGDILHLVNNEKVSTVSSTLIDMQWLEGQKFVAQLIWAMWGFSASEFIDQDVNRATAYVKRNITKTRMLQPYLRHIERKINSEILPFLKGYRKDWKFQFEHGLDLDDELKKAQINATKSTTFTVYRNQGLKPSIAFLLAGVGDDLDTETIESIDDIAEAADLVTSLDNLPSPDDIDQNRYGSDGYVQINPSDYSSGGEQTEQRFGEKEEREFSKGIKYIKSPSEAPEGVPVHRGERGGLYYFTSETKKKPEDTGGGQGQRPHKPRDREDLILDPIPERAPEQKVPDVKTTGKKPALIRVKGDSTDVILVMSDPNPKIVAKNNPESKRVATEIVTCVPNKPSYHDWYACANEIASEYGLKVISNLP